MTENITSTGENGLHSPLDPCTLIKLNEAVKLRRSTRTLPTAVKKRYFFTGI